MMNPPPPPKKTLNIENFFPCCSGRSKKGIRLIPFISSGERGAGDADPDSLELETDVAMRCLVAPDGTTLVAAGEGGKIHCWQWDDSDVQKYVPCPPPRINSLPVGQRYNDRVT